MIEGFFLGVIVTGSLTASAFFFKFWRQTHDTLFLGFAAAFMIEAVNRIAFLFLENPNEGAPLLYGVRLLSYLLILAAIVNKNRA
jgi:uncharacterized membrane protein HdeD (DUF308 family)